MIDEHKIRLSDGSFAIADLFGYHYGALIELPKKITTEQELKYILNKIKIERTKRSKLILSDKKGAKWQTIITQRIAR